MAELTSSNALGDAELFFGNSGKQHRSFSNVATTLLWKVSGITSSKGRLENRFRSNLIKPPAATHLIEALSKKKEKKKKRIIKLGELRVTARHDPRKASNLWA